MTSFFGFSCYKKSRVNGLTYCNKIKNTQLQSSKVCKKAVAQVVRLGYCLVISISNNILKQNNNQS